MGYSPPDLTSEAAGIVILRTRATGGVSEFVCTSVAITMELNQIPCATVVIGAGRGVREPGNRQTPEELLREILSRRDQAYVSMVACDLYEVDPHDASRRSTRQHIFSGLIATGTMVYHTGSPTVKQIRLQVMNRAILLYSNPTSQMATVTGQYVTDLVTNHGNRQFAAGNSNSTVWDATKYPLTESISRMRLSANIPVIGHVATILSEVIYAKSYRTLKGGAGREDWISKILSCFCGNTRLADPPGGLLYEARPSLTESFDHDLLEAFESRMENDSVYGAMSAVLLSDRFMLNFAPRWSDKDFKLELVPSRAWAPGTPIRIPQRLISGIDTAYNPTTCLQTPDVFIVNFDDAVSTMFGEQTALVSERPGVYSVNKVAQDAWRNALSLNSVPPSRVSDVFHARIYNAPRWTTPLAMRPGAITNVRRSVRDTATRRFGSAYNRKAAPMAQTASAADIIAEALFSYIYGREDKCTLDLFLSTRFCQKSGIQLEKNIGSVIDVEFEDDESMSIRGVLNKITYNYACGSGVCRAAYSIELSCVRPLQGDTVSIPCPLYR